MKCYYCHEDIGKDERRIVVSKNGAKSWGDMEWAHAKCWLEYRERKTGQKTLKT